MTHKTAKILFGTSRAVDALPATVTCLRHVASYAMQTSELEIRRNVENTAIIWK